MYVWELVQQTCKPHPCCCHGRTGSRRLNRGRWGTPQNRRQPSLPWRANESIKTKEVTAPFWLMKSFVPSRLLGVSHRSFSSAPVRRLKAPITKDYNITSYDGSPYLISLDWLDLGVKPPPKRIFFPLHQV